MADLKEPIGYTCRDIDAVIQGIDEVMNDLNDIEDLPAEAQAVIDNVVSRLYHIGGFKNKQSLLEELRSSNSKLRDWGNDLVSDVKSLQEERDEWEDRYNEAIRETIEQRETIKDLESKVEEFEQEVDELETRVEELNQEVKGLLRI